MFAATKWTVDLAWLGWPGVAAVVVALVGQLAAAHAVARWVFGDTPGYGRRVVAAGAVAAGLWIVGVVAWNGLALPLWAVQVFRGGACGVVLGLAAVLSSARPPTAPGMPSSPVTVNPVSVRRFHSILFVAAAVGFIIVGSAIMVVGIVERSALLAGFGLGGALVGVGLARLAWVVRR